MMRIHVALVLTLGFLFVGAGAHAQIGQPAETILGPLQDLEPTPRGDGWYESAEGFRIRVIERGGRAFRLEGEGTLTDANRTFAAAAIARASGLDESIREPVETFFRERSPELAGQGRVAVGLDAYVLTLDVAGESPYDVTFSFAFAQLDTGSFPAAVHALGPADASYVIREFSDFQCPFCADYALDALPFVKDALLERGDVRFEYHHFPLQSIHPNAAPAAEAAECVTAANDPDAFWTYHDALFERQDEWAQLGEPTSTFVELAAALDLDTEGVAECIQEGRYEERVAEAYRIAAGELRLRGTPSVFVNGFRLGSFLELQSYLDLFARIDAFRQDEAPYDPDPGEARGGS